MLWKGINKFRHIEVAPGGASYGFGDYNTLGKKYFVNNIVGSSVNDGARWDRAMDEISTAITAHMAHLAELPANNRNIRGTIIVQGTNQKYKHCATLPNYCDIIGLGANPRGSTEGIVIICEALYASLAGNARGLNMYNIQVGGIGDYYCMDVTTLLRSVFEDCAFMADNENSVKQLIAAIRATANFASVTMLRCLIGATNGAFATDIGIDLNTCSGVANNTLIKDCEIIARAHGIKEKTTLNDGGMVIRENVIRGDLGVAAVGIQAGLYVFIVNNSIAATNGIDEAETSQQVNNTIVTS